MHIASTGTLRTHSRATGDILRIDLLGATGVGREFFSFFSNHAQIPHGRHAPTKRRHTIANL